MKVIKLLSLQLIIIKWFILNKSYFYTLQVICQLRDGKVMFETIMFENIEKFEIFSTLMKLNDFGKIIHNISTVLLKESLRRLIEIYLICMSHVIYSVNVILLRIRLKRLEMEMSKQRRVYCAHCQCMARLRMALRMHKHLHSSEDSQNEQTEIISSLGVRWTRPTKQRSKWVTISKRLWRFVFSLCLCQPFTDKIY